MSIKPKVCRLSIFGMEYEFRLNERGVERRIMNADGTDIHPGISEWTRVSDTYILHMKIEHSEFKKWLGRHQFNLAQDEVS